MPRDNNPTHQSSDDESTTRDNNPTTVKHGGRSTSGYEEECPACGHFGLEGKQVPGADGPSTKKVCPECGHAIGDERPQADKV